MTMSIRLDARTEAWVKRTAKRRGVTQSDVIRDALTAQARQESSGAALDRPYEAIAHLVGCARGGPPDLSERTGDRFRALLAARPR